MDIEEIPARYLKEIKKYSSMADHTKDAYRLSAAFGVRVRPGELTSVIPGPPVTIILEPHLFGPVDNEAILHEMAHVFMWWTKIEEALIEEHGCLELALPQMEVLCRAATLFLRAPQPIVDKAVKRYGVSAKAVNYVRRAARISVKDALRRVVYDDPSAERAGFIVNGKYVSEVAMCNFQLPFWFCDRVPEPAQLVAPEGSRITLGKGLHPQQVIGIYTT